MSSDPRIQAEKLALREARAKGGVATIKTYLKFSGPGWLLGAITLGGGSLVGSLYLGVIAGYSLLWLQVIAMMMGIILLSAITFVTLSTGKRPFRAINDHVNPVLGWGWAVATIMASIVWCLPQFNLGTAAVKQNLLSGVTTASPWFAGYGGTALVCVVLLGLATSVIWFYDTGYRGVRIFEWILKGMVALIVLSFFGVVVKLLFAAEGLALSQILRGFIPDPTLLARPADTFHEALAAAGQYAAFWSDHIVSEQRDIMITAAATAVGINMTFLLPYAMLRKGWDRESRGLAIFDLGTGLFIPFVLATGCMVVATASQFHAKPQPGVVDAVYEITTREGERWYIRDDGAVLAANQAAANELDFNNAATWDQLPELAKTSAAANLDAAQIENISASVPLRMIQQYRGLLTRRLGTEMGAEAVGQLSASEREARIAALPDSDKALAAMLVRRDAWDLAAALEPLTGRTFSHFIFGLGVLGMALSTIIILMLITGFTICEMFNLPHSGWQHRMACLVAGLGVLGPFVWKGNVYVWLSVPTSVFGMTLLPIAALTFFLMLNNKALMGSELLKGGKRIVFNALVLIALVYAALGSGWSIWSRTQVMFGIEVRYLALAVVILFIGAAIVVHFVRPPKKPQAIVPESEKVAGL